MPGWDTHLAVAKQAVDRLLQANVPIDFPAGVDPKQLGEIAYKWRNYLAWGAIGPDIFYLLPDFKPPLGNDLMALVNWYLIQWKNIDDLFLASWDDYAAPAVRGVGDILNQMSGGVIREIGEAHQELSKACQDLLLDLLSRLCDWFGWFTSGVPSGFSENEFYWSDMFHYRSTYKFAHQLFKNARSPEFKANTEQLQAFAIGWMSHCATDVTGHSFVNEKVGGPWRLHSQRHHLVENHMDAKIYDTQHNGVEPYGELDTSCLHFWLAFRKRTDAPYANGGSSINDGPAYDYFKGFPPYDGHDPLSGLDTSDSDAGDNNRAAFFDMDMGGLNDDLARLLIKTMNDVYADPVKGNPTPQAPQILKCTDPAFHDDDSGRPSPVALKNTFAILFDYVKKTHSSGYSPPVPKAPPVFNDHSPPPFPHPSEDAARGEDPQSEPNSIVAVLFAAFAFLLWLAEFGAWLVTLPEAVVADLLTYGPRELLYLIAVQPLYSLYVAMRQPLVMSAFVHPKHSEISQGLVQLGASPSDPLADLAKALQSVGIDLWPPPPSPPTSEPSGRSATAGSAYEVDTAYPRAVVTDTPELVRQLLDYACSVLGIPNSMPQPSEFLRPWRYPELNNAGQKNDSELPKTHSGPWLQGQSAEVLLNTSPGLPQARRAFERAKTPEECEAASDFFFNLGAHLGDPVDYSLYLIGRLTDHNLEAKTPPDFNLDSDRGYGYHCWDWDRYADKDHVLQQGPACPEVDRTVTFQFNQPCTVPEGSRVPNEPRYDYLHPTDLDLHFEEQPNPQCIVMLEKHKPKPKP